MEGDWEKYSSEHRQFFEVSVPSMLEKYLASSDWTVFLDVGCGDGGLLFSLGRRGWLEGKDVIAVDISENRIGAVQRINPAFRCYVDDACKLANVKDSSVDVLASLQVIEHVPNDEDMVFHPARVLTDGGLSYVTTVFKRPGAWYIYRNADGEHVIDPTHVREYKDDHLLDVFEKHGLEVLESRKSRVMKPVLGFFILGRLSRDRDLLMRHPVLRTARKLKYPLPGYYYWEIAARKRGQT